MLGLACARGLDRSAVQELVGFLKEERGGGGEERVRRAFFPLGLGEDEISVP